MKKDLYTALSSYPENGRAPFHMPGHKRSGNYYYLNNLGANLDITEIDGFDNLHNAQEILKDGMDLLSDKYGSDRSFYLINGSTGGILASIRASVNYGDEIIVSRTCHKAVYNAIELNGLTPHFIYPETDKEFKCPLSVNAADIETAFELYPDSKAVVITSPTYEGVMSDIKAIADICHKHSSVLIVDEAHGAHTGFSDYITSNQKSAISSGADIVIQSFHKTLPSLTQTAVAHVKSDLVSPDKVARELAVFETSSPSYLLLASLDGCTHLLDDVRNHNSDFFIRWEEKIKYFEEKLNFRNISRFVPDIPFDRSKFVISHASLSGMDLAQILRRYNIEPEMITADYVLLMTGADTEISDIDLCISALREADRIEGKAHDSVNIKYPKNDCAFIPSETRSKPVCEIDYTLACGKISADYVFAYPPGIPVIIPGEIISSDAISAMKSILDNNLNPSTMRGEFDGIIRVVEVL